MITMKKIIRKTGMSLGVTFNKQECQIYDIEEGDIIDFGDIVVIKKKRSKKK